MEKPKQLSLKDFLIRKMGVKLMLDESLIDTVVSHQFQMVREKMDTCNSIEVSGFGVFKLNTGRVIKHAERMKKGINNMNVSEERKEQLLNKFNALEKRSYGNKSETDLGGVEESLNTPQTTEGINRENSKP